MTKAFSVQVFVLFTSRHALFIANKLFLVCLIYVHNGFEFWSLNVILKI
jgi:hypothetical protein